MSVARSLRSFPNKFPFVLLAALLVMLLLAGGASRGDVIGQAVVRAVAWICFLAILLFGDRRPLTPGRPVLVLLLAALAIAVIQLVPLPPAWWMSLPGREPFATTNDLIGTAAWRPIAIVPWSTLNALGSLIVPFAVFSIAVRCGRENNSSLVALLLAVAAASMFVGLLQFSGLPLRNPFVNGEPGVDGLFANRNHYALFLAIGCLLAPVWGFAGRSSLGWRGLAAIGLLALFALTILASGSRSGVIAGLVAIALGPALVAQDIQHGLARYPPSLRRAVIVGVIAMMIVLMLLSIFANRAVSVDRALSLDMSQDMRVRALPLLPMILREYFSVGAGLGGFEPIFRMHEPLGLLKATYFNRAHNDFLEIVLDAGLVGTIILFGAILWWGWTSLRAWSVLPNQDRLIPRLGSAILLLILLTSIFDYPARTPMMMAIMVIAGIWLSSYGRRSSDY